MDLTVTIVRHGNTFEAGELPRRIGARTDLPLVSSGRAQADALGKVLANQRFDRVLSSPLARTRETAERILAHQARASKVEMAEWLVEIDHGPDEDQTEADVAARIGLAALSAWEEEGRVPPGWTVDADVRRNGWNDLWRIRGKVLVVTSNGAARFALLSDPVLHRQALVLPSLKLRTGAYGVVERSGDALRLTAWDRRP